MRMSNTFDDFDGPWKGAIDCLFPELMTLFFPATAAELDFARPVEFLDTELAQAIHHGASGGQRHVDRLIRAHARDGRPRLIYLHIEIQCQRETRFAERMALYHAMLFVKFRQPIVSVAILGDEDQGWRPSEYSYGNADCAFRLRFRSIKLLDLAPDLPRLAAAGDPVALFACAHLAALQTKREPLARLALKVDLTRVLYEHGWTEQRMLDVRDLVDWILRLPDKEERQYQLAAETMEENKMLLLSERQRLEGERLGIARGMEQGLLKGREQGLQEGLQQGLQQGRLQGLRQGFLQMMEARFGRLPPDLRSIVEQGGKPEFERWAKRLCEAHTIHDVLA